MVIFILVELMVVAVHSTLVLSDRAHSIQTIHNKPPLRFHREDESSSETTTTKTKNTTKYFFTILQLADIHLGENAWEDWGPEQDRKTFGALQSILRAEQPDLIIFSGDQLTANNINDNATEYIDLLAQHIAPFDIPWAMIFGNHDDAPLERSTNDNNGVIYHSAKTSRRRLVQADAQHTLSLTQIGPSELPGVSNYWLDIVYETSRPGQNKEADHSLGTSNNDVIGARILLLDSGGGSLEQRIDESHIQWFHQTNHQHADIPVIAFQHIPSTLADFSFSESRCRSGGGGGNDTSLAEDGVAPLEYDGGIVQALRVAGNVHILAVGHNHGNDYCCRLPGESVGNNDDYEEKSFSSSMSPNLLHLCFGRHSGYGGYGSWDRGARVYRLQLAVATENDKSSSGTVVPSFSWMSYVRMESDEVIHLYNPYG